jgi:hypothetical protein
MNLAGLYSPHLMNPSDKAFFGEGGHSPMGATSAQSAESQQQPSPPSSSIHNWLALLCAVLALWGLFGVGVLRCMHKESGHFTYAIDDAYISMSIAKNFAEHGVWGFQGNQFASMASSPGWVLLTAAVFKATGPSIWVPLAMNVFFGTLVLILVWAIFRSFNIRPFVTFVGLMMVLFLTPIVPVAFTGLEHVLQTLVDLAYVFAASQALGGDAPAAHKRRAFAIMLLLSPILTLVRYEGGFFLALAGCMLLARRQILLAVLTGILGLLPIVVSGIIFVSHGWFFLPTSILLKGNTLGPSGLLYYMAKFPLVGIYRLTSGGSHLSVLLGLVLLGWFYLGRPILSSRLGVMVTLFFGAAVMHLQLARLGWFYRYEAYLVCLGLVILTLLTAQFRWRSLWPESWLRSPIVALSVFLILGPLIARGYEAHYYTPISSYNIYEQQYQMAQFLRTYYSGSSVAANDIGAIGFFSDVHCLDLYGLGSIEVARLKHAGHYTTSSIRDLAREDSVKIALVYDSWYENYGGLPPEWTKVAEWTISDNFILGGSTVAFYAVDPEEAPALLRHVQDFARQLPKSVAVTFPARNTAPL